MVVMSQKRGRSEPFQYSTNKVHRSQDLLAGVSRSSEVEHVAMSLEPARPLVSEQGHEPSRLMEALGCLADLLPDLRVCVEEAQTPVVVVGECDDVEGCDVARVLEVVVGRAGAVRQARVPVEVPPEQRLDLFTHQERVRFGFELAELGVGAQLDPVGAGPERGCWPPRA